MVATATVMSWNGGTDGTPTIVAIPSGQVRFKDADENDITGTNPVTIEASVKFCFWKHIAIQFTGTYTTIDNIRHYTDGTITWTLGTAGEARRGNRDTGDHGVIDTSYEIADGKDDIEVGHTFYSGQTVKSAVLSGDTSGAPATIDTTSYSAPPDDTKAIVMQVKVDTDASPGAQGAETFTFLYDEI